MSERSKAFTEAADLCDYEATGYDEGSAAADALQVMATGFREVAAGKEMPRSKFFHLWQRARLAASREQEVPDDG